VPRLRRSDNVGNRYGPGTWLTLLGFRFCPKARGNAGKVNKDETTICFHLSFEISPNARDSNIPTATAASILTPFARKKDWRTSSTVNHVPGPKCQPCARSVQIDAQPCRAGLTFGGRPYGPQSPDRFLEKHSQDEPAELQIPIRLRSGQALGFARDDKGEGGASMEGGCWTEGVFHLLRWAAGGLRPIPHSG
jgi:hypothetical protein